MRPGGDRQGDSIVQAAGWIFSGVGDQAGSDGRQLDDERESGTYYVVVHQLEGR
jgi:hypothetical protein